MKFSSFSLKAGICLALIFFTAQMFVPAFVTPARALYWEDDTDFNAPQDRLERPRGGFFLFKWIKSIKKAGIKHRAANLENHDKGPNVNGKKKAMILVTSGIVGLGIGLAISSTTTKNAAHRTRNNFLGAAFGLVGGMIIGSFIIPKDYQVDSSCLPDAKYRLALASDPALQSVRDAFHDPALQIVLNF